MKTIVSVCSARPNFVKLAAVHHALAKHSDIFEHLIVHTGQHYDPLLSDIFFDQLDIPQPNYNLGIAGGTREEVIETTAEAMIPVLEKVRPDIVLVYGDVNGAVGAARAAKQLGIKIGHVEAGLRSFDMTMPEEHNRIEIDEIADILLCSEQSGMDHLNNAKGEKFLVGNTMIDTLLTMKSSFEKLPLLAGKGGSFAIATLHRPSNVDTKEALQKNIKLLGTIAESMEVLLPVHPRLKASLQQFSIDIPFGVKTSDPLNYLSFLRHVRAAAFVFTDSGGVQEEAVLLGKRCFTLRKNTERPSTIDAGSNVLIDIEKEEDRNKVLAFAQNPVDPQVQVPELWDGKAGERIVKVLLERL